MVDGTAVWFGTAGFEVLGLVDDGMEVAVDAETTRAAVGCSACGTRAVPKDRRWVTPYGAHVLRFRMG